MPGDNYLRGDEEVTMQPPTKRTLAYCQTCNARERVVNAQGRCSTCGNVPSERVVVLDVEPVELQDPQPTRDPWTVLDTWLCGVCLFVTLYLVVQVVRWMI